MRTRRGDTKWIYRKHRAAHAHALGPSMSGQLNASKVGLSITHIRVELSAIEQIRYLALRRLGAPRPAFCDQASRLFGMPSRDRVSQEQRVERRKVSIPPAKPGALGFEPLKAAWGAADAARLLIPKVNTIIAQTSARLTGPSPARKPLASRLPGRQFQTCGTAQFHRTRRTRPIGDFRC
jgi:hypothetical protein